MHVRTLFNYAYHFKGFVYGKETLNRDTNTLTLELRARKGSKGRCSICGRPGPTYDHLPQRSFRMVPAWGITVLFLYALRRIKCAHCHKIRKESVPWSIGGKGQLTTAMAAHLAGWARFLSWKEVSRRCGVCWEHVADSVEWTVAYGLENRNLDGISAIGVDEIQYKKGHKYLTLVYQINAHKKRLLWIGKERTKETFQGFFDLIGDKRSQAIEFVCSDMWKAYLQVIAERAPNALNILDRFHIAQKLNDAVDQTRRDEVNRLKEQRLPALLRKTKWIWLHRGSNLNRPGRSRLRELLTINLTTVKAYLLKEDFDHFWSYTSPTWAGKFLDDWCQQVMRHRSLPHMKKVVGTLRNHRELIMNYFQAKQAGHGAFSSGVVEGLNNKVKVCIRKSYGFRSDRYREVALYHALGDLPVPKVAHRFG